MNTKMNRPEDRSYTLSIQQRTRLHIGCWMHRILAATALALSGCGAPQLIPTPNLYLGSNENPFVEVPGDFQNNQVDVLYVTDRRRVDEEKDGRIHYDYRRSASLAFGSATVQFGDEVTWEELVAASREHDRDISLPVEVVNIEEMHRFPATPFPYDLERDEAGGPIHYDPNVLTEHERAKEALRNEVRQRLAKTPTKEAYVYVHGYNNTFEEAVSVIAEIWHFLPRQGIPIAYTWPAGKGGLRGYFYDRESGEFTIFHLKEFLRILSSIEELEKLHIIAHSRGTDVILTALRELLIEKGGRDYVPPADRKIGNVILAAPDLDQEVLRQRVAAEELTAKIERFTIYMSKSDFAIGLSTWLFESQMRIGRIGADDVSKRGVERLSSQYLRGMAVIDARVDSGFIGHSYFYSHPAVLSDLILILRDGRDPGQKNGRPLIPHSGHFWAITDEYPDVTRLEGKEKLDDD